VRLLFCYTTQACCRFAVVHADIKKVKRAPDSKLDVSGNFTRTRATVRIFAARSWKTMTFYGSKSPRQQEAAALQYL